MNDDQEFALYKQLWVIFRVNGGLFALPISVVEEMVSLGEVTALPGADPYVPGLMKLRDRTLPLLDLRLLLDGSASKYDGGSSFMEIGSRPDDGWTQHQGEKAEDSRTVVVMHHQGRRLGVMVEEMVAVEPLPRRVSALMEVAPGLKDGHTPVSGVATHEEIDGLVLTLDHMWLLEKRYAMPPLGAMVS